MNFEMPNIEEIKSFSKENASDERDELASKLRESRTAYFERKAELEAQLEDIRGRREVSVDVLAGLVEEISGLELELEKRRGFNFRLLKDKLEKRNVRKEYDSAQEQLEAELLEAEGLAIIEERLLEQLEDRHIIDEAKSELDKFYAGQAEKLDQYLESENGRQLETIRDKYRARGVFFVHGIDPDFVPRDNSVLNCNVDWQTKLKIALSMEPTLSTSTVEKGDKPWRTWSPFGLIVSEGRVLSARPGDAGTKASISGKRITSGQMLGVQTVGEEIDVTLERRAKRYNEFTVESPRYSALYIFREQKGEPLSRKYIQESDIKDLSEQLGLPVYVIVEGVPYEAKYDKQSQAFIEGEEADFEAVTSLTKEFSAVDRARMIEELAEDSPFRIPEIGALDSWSRGHRAYQESDIVFADKFEDYIPWEEGDDEKIGTEVEVLAEFSKPGSKVQYLRKDRQVFVREKDVFSPHKRDHEYRVRNITTDLKREKQKGGVYVYSGLYVPFEGTKESPDWLLGGLEKEIGKMLRDYHEDIQDSPNEQRKKFWLDTLEKVGFFLHGFAEEAETSGNTQVANRAREIASRLVDQSSYEKVVKLIDEDGKLSLAPEELIKSYGSKND